MTVIYALECVRTATWPGHVRHPVHTHKLVNQVRVPGSTCVRARPSALIIAARLPAIATRQLRSRPLQPSSAQLSAPPPQ